MAPIKIEPGAIIDGYQLGERLHVGGMATLWSVSKLDQTGSGQCGPDQANPLLMKLPNMFEGDDPAAIVSFEMEQMILPRLNGKHVPSHCSQGDFSTQPYLVMERIIGKSLLGLLDELPLPVEKIAEIGAEIALALDDLHGQHVVHLDIKPSNLMRRENGDIVLIDFGLSRHDQLPDLMAEEFRLPYGTAPYMAPEQVMGVRNDPRSDLFALGVLMYFFATGIRPFGDPQSLSGLKRRLWDDPLPPRALKPELPLWFQEIVLHCLEVELDRRYPTAAQLAFDLQHPQSVTLTERAHKLKRDGFWTRWRRRMAGEPLKRARQGAVAAQMGAAPIILLALDVDQDTSTLDDDMRRIAARIVRATPAARLACINVLKLARLTIDRAIDEDGTNKHAARLGALRRWAQPLNLPDDRVTYHTLENVDPAAAILDYVARNRVDHIVIGARADVKLAGVLGSVAAQIAAQAPCTVTIVRKRHFGTKTAPQ